MLGIDVEYPGSPHQFSSKSVELFSCRFKTFLIVPPPNFAIFSSWSPLRTLTSTCLVENQLSSTPTLGTLRFASPHSLAPQASSLLLDVTLMRHFVHVVRSLSMPWKPQRLPQQLFLSVSVSFSGPNHRGSEA